MIYAVTGHRPPKLGGYGEDAQAALDEFALRTVARIRPQGAIVGMAQGWDQSVAVACVRLGISFVAAVPFKGQELRWPSAGQDRYHRLLSAASLVHYVWDDPDEDHMDQAAVNFAMQQRNEWMVDHAQAVLALWDGEKKGGTFNCVGYAQFGRRPITNVWNEWYDWWDCGGYLV